MLKVWKDNEMGWVKILIIFLRFERRLDHQFGVGSFHLSFNVKLYYSDVLYQKNEIYLSNYAELRANFTVEAEFAKIWPF